MSHVNVSTDLTREPWPDITGAAFGHVERIGFVPADERGPSSVAVAIRLESGQWVVGMIELSLYVKASATMQRAHVERQTQPPPHDSIKSTPRH